MVSIKYNSSFFIDAYTFICILNSMTSEIHSELSKLCINNYSDKFKNTIEAINSIRYNITRFVNKWEDDDLGICQALERTKEFCGYYRDTLSESSPRLFHIDAKYVKESLDTSRVVLKHKLKILKDKCYE